MDDQDADEPAGLIKYLIPLLMVILAFQIHWSLTGVIVWYFLLKRLEDNGTLDRWKATRLFGVILMIRTKRGQGALEFISRPKRAWRAFGELSLWTCRVASAIVLIFFILTFILTMLNPGKVEPASPGELILIPGITPTIPLGWGIFALIVTLVAHEYGHGIVVRAHGMRVRSFGALMLGLVPIGAFAEPESSELHKAPRRERQRVFAAGPSINIYGGFLCFLMMAMVANTFVPAIDGVHYEGLVEGQPAEQSGMEPWEVITHIDGESIENLDDFVAKMDKRSAGDSVVLTVLGTPDESGSRESRSFDVVLSDQYQYYIDGGTDPLVLEAYGIEEGDAFLGVVGLASNDAGTSRLAGPLASEYPKTPRAVSLGLVTQPLQIVLTPLTYKGEVMHSYELDLVENHSPLGLEGGMFLLHALFWLTWMNVLLGFANLIPLVPFDGGHLLRDRIHDYLEFFSKRFTKTHPLKVRRMANRISAYSSLTILGMIAMIIIAPYFF